MDDEDWFGAASVGRRSVRPDRRPVDEEDWHHTCNGDPEPPGKGGQKFERQDECISRCNQAVQQLRFVVAKLILRLVRCWEVREASCV